MNKKNVYSTICFILITVCVWSYLTNIFTRKEDLTIWNDFYSCPSDSIDILVMGSSLSAMGVDTYQLGAATNCEVFNLSVAAQTTPARVYFLKEVLKTQKPKLVVMETYRYLGDPNSMAIDEILYSMSGMKMSWNKLEMMLKVPIREQYQEKRLEIILPLFAGHNRWDSLKKQDFEMPQGTTSASKGSYNVKIEVQPPLSKISEEVTGVADVQKPYLEEIITLCKDNDIELLFFNTPNPEIDENGYKSYNALYEYLEQQNVSYLDCNYDEKMREWIDTTTDFCDYHHTNAVGMYKATRFLADYINEHYSYISKESLNNETYENFYDYKNELLLNCTEILPYLMYLYADQYECYVDICDEHVDEVARKLLNKLEYKEWETDMDELFDVNESYGMKLVVKNKMDASIVDVAYVPIYNNQQVIHQDTALAH